MRVQEETPFPHTLLPLPSVAQPTYLCRKKIGVSSQSELLLMENAESWFVSLDKNKAKQGYNIFLRTVFAGETRIHLKLISKRVRLQHPWRSLMRLNRYTTDTEAGGIAGDDEAPAAAAAEVSADDGPDGGSVKEELKST